MKLTLAAVMICAFPINTSADGIVVTGAYTPMSPPGSMVHAAYMTILNTDKFTRSLVGVTANEYHTAHLHHSMEQDGINSMTPLHQLDIQPGQNAVLSPGSMHIMLMKPIKKIGKNDEITLVLEFANGEKVFVTTAVRARDGTS